MRYIRTVKKMILHAEKLLIENNLAEALSTNAKASKLLVDSNDDKSIEILKNKLVRQHNEITICMLKSLSPEKISKKPQ
jgi:3'-phosphoadenosine 5'-phosphosulfate (PAPS) 3'-phosphatase